MGMRWPTSASAGVGRNRYHATQCRASRSAASTSAEPARWRAHVTDDDGRADRRRSELRLLSELRTALRSGAVWVQGSRRNQPADRYLITSAAWPARRDAAHRTLGLLASGRLSRGQLAGTDFIESSSMAAKDPVV
jgi:hypothetical protein